MPLTGVFAGPIAGLKYETSSCSGLTNDKGEFFYQEGERVVFLAGTTPIGSVVGAPRVNLAQIVSRVDGNVQKLLDPGLTNIARFLCTLDKDGDLDGGIVIAPEVHEILGRLVQFLAIRESQRLRKAYWCHFRQSHYARNGKDR